MTELWFDVPIRKIYVVQDRFGGIVHLSSLRSYAYSAYIYAGSGYRLIEMTEGKVLEES